MPKEPILDEKAREAVHAARDAAQATELARQSQIDMAIEESAKRAAERLGEKVVDEQKLARIIHSEITNVLSMGSDKERSIVLARVPYICSEITNINTVMDDMNKTFSEWEKTRVTKEDLEKTAVALATTAVTKADLNKFIYRVLGIIGTAVLLATVTFVISKVTA